MARENLLSLFNDFACFGGDAAVVQRRGYRREKLTYAELYASALARNHLLCGHGIQPGDRVVLWGPNSAEWIACFWGILLLGAVVVPMDAAANHEFVHRVVEEAGAKLILRDRQQGRLPGGPPSLVINDFQDVVNRTQQAVKSEASPGDHAKRSDIAEIIFTSGTTAEPRGVILTHGNFLANLEPIEQGIDAYRKYEWWLHPLRFVSLVPLSHAFGQFMALFVPPLLGAAVVFEPSANPSEIIRTAKRERATAVIAVPRMLDALRSGIERDLEARGQREWLRRSFAATNGQKFLRRAWRFRRIHRRFGWKFWAFISGGAALSNETEEFFKRLGYAVVQGYGMTETASLISLNHPFRATQGSVGKVLPGREFRLAEDGEILVRGENVAGNYWERGAPREAASENGGWLRTGDIGELDAEGNLHFRGRKKNVIVTPAGLNVYPEDLEAALRKQPGVRDCVVVPIEKNGNAEPRAILLMDSNWENQAQPATAGAAAKESQDQAQQCCAPTKEWQGAAAKAAVESANHSLAEYQRILEWAVWPEPDFPRTPTGKPRLRLIAARAADSLGDSSPAKRPPTILDDLLARFAKGASASGQLERELNLSSLDRVELMSALEERFHVELSETAFAEAKSTADVQRLLERPAARRSEYVYPRWTQRALVRWFRLAVYYALVWPATQILAHPKVMGREHLREVRGPLLIVSNHITRRADIGLILAALPQRFRHRLATSMAGETLQNMRHPPPEWFFAKRWAYQLGYWLVTALFNVFPLPQHSGFRESFRFVGESVDRGHSILVFPEGEVNNSETGEMAAFQAGIGLLSENLSLPIVPMRLDGVWQMKRERRRLAHFGEVTVRIGAPVHFPSGTPPNEIARELESLVKSL